MCHRSMGPDSRADSIEEWTPKNGLDLGRKEGCKDGSCQKYSGMSAFSPAWGTDRVRAVPVAVADMVSQDTQQSFQHLTTPAYFMSLV